MLPNTTTTAPQHAVHSAAAANNATHLLPSLPYEYVALEPFIDARTLKLHHDAHHRGYVDKLNAALAPYPELRRRSAPWLLLNKDAVPAAIRADVQHNAGGHVNHSLYWRSMGPPVASAPVGVLAAAIEQTYHGFDRFKVRFEEAGAKLFGSGWVWLVIASGAATSKPVLEIVTTAGHENPLQQGKYPLLVNDVWEHAYYLKYENRRPDYLQNWWSIVNWQEVTHRFEHPKESTAIEPAGGVLSAAAY